MSPPPRATSAQPATDTLRELIDRATAAGAHSADAVLVEQDSVDVRVRDAEIDFVKQAVQRTLGLRVFVAGPDGLRSAITSTSDLAPASLARLADDSLALARCTAQDPSAGLPDGGFADAWPDLDLLAEADRAVGVDERIERCRRAEAAARAADPRVTNSEGAEIGSAVGRVAYASSAGFAGAYESASHGISCSPIAQDGEQMQTDFWHSASRHLADLESPEDVGRTAAQRAVAMLGARRVPTAEVPVVFDATTARSLLANLMACVTGGAVYRGSSFLAERLGETIASSAVTVVDDGRVPGGLGSRPFDGEGQATRRTVVVEGGRLASWLLDSYSARKLGMQTTGNAARSAGSGPSVGPGNLWIEPGDASQDALVADTARGLLVTGLFGHGFNPVTGDFSRGARGFWIEDGEIVHPVEEVTVAGNLGEMLERVDGIGSEILWQGRIAAPPLRIARMTVGGS